MTEEQPRLSYVFIENSKIYDSNTHKKFKVVSISAAKPDLVAEADIYLEMSWLSGVNMMNLDKALQAVEIKRTGYRIYWQAGVNCVLPVFNYITLSSAIHTMALNNNIFYFIKKDQSRRSSSSETYYRINPNDRDLILRVSAAKMDPQVFRGYTRYEETIHKTLTCAARGEHLPLASVLPADSKKPDKASKKGDKSAKSATPKSKK